MMMPAVIGRYWLVALYVVVVVCLCAATWQ